MVNAVARFVFCLAILPLLACQHRELEVRSQDLLAPGGLSTEGGPIKVRQGVCADETGWLLEVAPRQLYAVAVDATLPQALSLQACAVARRTGKGPACFTVRSGATEQKVCARADGWTAESLPIPAGVDRIEIVGGRHALLLREARLRSQRLVPRRPLDGPPGRQILLISVDTLRPDALSALGGDRPTPHLDAFARQAQVFRRHYAGSHWTKPSHGTLLTGQPAVVHGANEFDLGLNPKVKTLAERFHEAGFATEANVRAIANLDPRWGFARGFDVYTASERRAASSAGEVLSRAQALNDRPFFLFLHLFEAHSDFSALPYESRGTNRQRLEQEFGVRQYGCRERKCASELLKALDGGQIAATADDRRLLPTLYRRGVEDVDALLGGLFDELRSTGLWDRLTIVVTSDHGESLLEHGHTLHTVYYEPVSQVPLLVKWAAGAPGAPAETLAGPTSACDVAPTLLEAAGLPLADLPCRSLLGPPGRRVIVAGGGLEMVVEGNWKAIWPFGEAIAGSAAPQPQIFDLAQDPGENDDLAARRPDRVEYLSRLRQGAQEGFARLGVGGPGEPGSLSAEEIQKLRALGYLN
jgi:arylsulfatase A-like enzyme